MKENKKSVLSQKCTLLKYVHVVLWVVWLIKLWLGRGHMYVMCICGGGDVELGLVKKVGISEKAH